MFVQGRTAALRPTRTLTGDTTLTKTDSGKTIYLAAAGGGTVTLPNEDGFNCLFILTVVNTTDWIIASGTADKFAGTVLSASGGAEDTEAAATADNMTFQQGTCVIGDRAWVDCDGTNTYGVGVCSATGGITFEG